MIIDTNGFNVGEEAWCVDRIYNCPFTPSKCKILSFIVYEDGIIYANTLVGLIGTKSLFHTEQECQIACDKLNCKM